MLVVSMERAPNQAKTRGDVKTALVFIGFCLVLMAVIAMVFYYLNTSNELLPEGPPGSPVDRPVH